MLAPNIFWSVVHNLLHCTFLAPRILRWLLGSRKISAHLYQGNGMVCGAEWIELQRQSKWKTSGHALVYGTCSVISSKLQLVCVCVRACVRVRACAHCCTRTALPTSYPASQPLATNRFTLVIQRNVQRSPTSCPQWTYSADTARETTGELIRRWL